MADFVGKITRKNVWATGHIYTLLVFKLNHIPMNLAPKTHYRCSITIRKNEKTILSGSATITLELNRRDITGLHVFNQLSCVVRNELDTSLLPEAEFYIENVDRTLNEDEIAEMRSEFANDMKAGGKP
jgi:hypothetical protein